MEPIESLQLFEADAVEWLVDSFSDRLLRAAFLILGDLHLAEDAVQDCLLDAIMNITTFRAESSIYTWLYTILVRRCRRYQLKYFWKNISFTAKEVVAPDSLAQIEQRQVVRKAVGSLAYKYREVITLHYYEDFSIAEIATLLKAPPGTIKSRLHRARLLLQDILGKGADFDER